jgi:hypothetical protein
MSPGHAARRRPRVPWFKDEQIPGTGLPNARSMRIFIAALCLFAVLAVVAIIYLIDVGQKANSAARTAKQVADRNRIVVAQLNRVVKEQADTARRNHASRLEDQAATDAKIRQIYCLLVAQAPDDPGKPIIGYIRVHYRCGPFNPANVGQLTPAQKAIIDGAAAPAPATTTNPPTHAQPSSPPHGRRSPTSPPTTPARPRPTATAPSPSPRSSTPVLQLCLPPLVCIHLP